MQVIRQGQRRRAIRVLAAVMTTGALLSGCGGGANGGNTSDVTVDLTATYQVSSTQIAEAKAAKATATRNAASTATPIPSPSPAESPTAVPWANVTPSAPYQGDIMAEIANIADVPAGYAIDEERMLTAQDIADGYLDADGYLRKLEMWGFRQGAGRRFSGGEELDLIVSGIIEFGSPEQARASIEDSVTTIKRYLAGDPDSQTLDLLGRQATALQGDPLSEGDRGIWAFVWVQQENLVFSFRGGSEVNDPMQYVLEVAQKAVAH